MSGMERQMLNPEPFTPQPNDSCFLQLILRWINMLLRPCLANLFATRLNYKHPHYISWHPASMLGNMDSLLMICLISICISGKVPLKVTGEKCSLIIIAPVWQSQALYCSLLEYLVQSPVLIPLSINILQDLFGR